MATVQSRGEWFRTKVALRQGCVLSSTLFNTFPKWIMSDALKEHDRHFSTGSRNITNLWFADNIDVLAKEEKLDTIQGDELCPFLLDLCISRHGHF